MLLTGFVWFVLAYELLSLIGIVMNIANGRRGFAQISALVLTSTLLLWGTLLAALL